MSFLFRILFTLSTFLWAGREITLHPFKHDLWSSQEPGCSWGASGLILKYRFSFTNLATFSQTVTTTLKQGACLSAAWDGVAGPGQHCTSSDLTIQKTLGSKATDEMIFTFSCNISLQCKITTDGSAVTVVPANPGWAGVHSKGNAEFSVLVTEDKGAILGNLMEESFFGHEQCTKAGRSNPIHYLIAAGRPF